MDYLGGSIKQFLLIYDRKHDCLVKNEEFDGNDREAAIAYRAAEQMYRDQTEMDVVLIGADSLETVKRTHSTYFRGFDRTDLEHLVTSLAY